MNWFTDLFTENTFIQAVTVLSLISATGLALGNIKVFGISFGVTFVFFAGIIAGHFGISIDPEMLALAQNFGLILYIYALGVQVGPGFFSSFKHGGIKANLLATVLLIIGTLMAMIIHWTTGISAADTVGLLAGAVTNTPMLGAGQQALLQINPDDVQGTNSMAMACATAYPFGLIGMILSVMILRKIFEPKEKKRSAENSTDNTFITEYQISNPAIFGQQENVDWNKKDIDWNAIDSQLVSSKVLVTKSEHNGVKLGDLKLRNSYGINITRVNRAGIDLLPSRSLRLQLGDKLTIVGEARAIDNVSKILGNESKALKNPNLISIFIGIVLGIILGSIPIAIPGISMPVKLGIAGGPIIVGILMGSFGPRFHIATYTTRSANLMLRQFGLTLYLAGLGLSAGAGFFETVFSLEGLKWVAISLFLATVPVILMGIAAAKIFKLDYADNIGMLCGGMANPFALDYAYTDSEGDDPAAVYATVYPANIFLRVISAQLLIMLLA